MYRLRWTFGGQLSSSRARALGGAIIPALVALPTFRVSSTAVVAVVAAASTLAGAALAGFLERGTRKENLKVGALTGLWAMLAWILVASALFMESFFSPAALVSGEMSMDQTLRSVAVTVVGVGILLPVLAGTAGGALGGYVADRRN